MEKEMQEIYQEIAETVNDMIPEEWYEFYFYAQMSDTGGRVYFFYNTLEDKMKYQYSIDIPEDFNLDERAFDQADNHLYKLGRRMYDLFKAYGQDLWYSFTMHVTSAGKLKVNYDYTDWFEIGDFFKDFFGDQMVLWEHKYLGAEPKDAEEEALIKRYLEEFPDNPI